MVLLYDILTKVYDIYVQNDKYYALTKWARRQDNVKYDLRDVVELKKEMKSERIRGFASSLQMMTTAVNFSTSSMQW
jgi:chaperone required for assembly of F1-ATPase